MLIGFALAIPISYYAMSLWLADFIYRIEVGFMPFLLAGFLALTIAWLTVSFQSVKAAFENPINALHYE